MRSYGPVDTLGSLTFPLTVARVPTQLNPMKVRGQGSPLRQCLEAASPCDAAGRDHDPQATASAKPPIIFLAPQSVHSFSQQLLVTDLVPGRLRVGRATVNTAALVKLTICGCIRLGKLNCI